MMCFRNIPAAKNFGYKKGCQDFPPKIFCLPMPKIFEREPYCVVFQENSGSEKDYGLERGVSRSSVERFCVSECRKFRRGKFLCCVSGNFR